MPITDPAYRFSAHIYNDEEFPLAGSADEPAALLDVFLDLDVSHRGAWEICRVGVQGYSKRYGYRTTIRWLDDDCALAKAIYERINTPEYQADLADWVRDRMEATEWEAA